jgi:hypothetical protein
MNLKKKNIFLYTRPEGVSNKHNLDCNKSILADNKLIFRTNKSMRTDNKLIFRTNKFIVASKKLIYSSKLVKAK